MELSYRDHLRQIVVEKFPEWRVQFGGEIVGVHVGRKTIKGKEKSKFSIVFHVRKKLKRPKLKLPAIIEVTINGKKRKIPTDVLATGNFKFHNGIQIGDKTQHTHSSTFGTIGLFLKRNGQIYGCSNMHVLGEPLLRHSINSYYQDISQQTVRNSIFSSSQNITQGFLEQAIFGDLDAAISRIDDTNLINNSIKNIGINNGIIILSDSNYNLPVKISTNRGILFSTVRRFGVALPTQYYNVYATLTDLICLDRVATGGDSGAVCVTNNSKLVGIVVGSDQMFTYLIPVWKILNYFNATLL